jgi:phage terminase large subunit
LGVGHLFEIQKDRIKDIYGGFVVFEGMQDHNAESIKSFEGFDCGAGANNREEAGQSS